MGWMIFNGEQVKEYLPSRDNAEDWVGLIGAWLINKGAGWAGLLSYLGLIAFYLYKSFCIAADIILHDIGVFFGIVMAPVWASIYVLCLLVGACLVGAISFIVAAIVCMFGFVCFNKWTLLITIILSMVSWYCFKYRELLMGLINSIIN